MHNRTIYWHEVVTSASCWPKNASCFVFFILTVSHSMDTSCKNEFGVFIFVYLCHRHIHSYFSVKVIFGFFFFLITVLRWWTVSWSGNHFFALAYWEYSVIRNTVWIDLVKTPSQIQSVHTLRYTLPVCVCHIKSTQTYRFVLFVSKPRCILNIMKPQAW